MEDKVEAKHEVLLRSLAKFYDGGDNLPTLQSILNGSTRMSLRVLDWLVTNFAKKRNIVYPTTVNGRDVTFNMFLEYKSQLKAYSKRFFDPFCRRERVEFHGIETTVGQLNFLKWAIQYGVIGYAKERHDDIEHDMLQSIQHRYAPLKVKEVKPAPPSKYEVHSSADHIPEQDEVMMAKRKELSRAAIKTCTTTMVKVKVKFS
jgi:hypothetical protein